MMRSARIAALVLLFAAVTLSVLAQTQATPEPIEPAAIDVAKTALVAFRGLVKDYNYRDLGFDSVAEVANATLGAPMGDRFVSLSAVRAFTDTTDPKQLLKPGPRVLFPVLVGGALRSSITVVHRPDGKWKAAEFGSPSYVHTLESAREQAASTLGLGKDVFFVVRIPALSTQFLAFSGSAGVSFVVVADDRRFELKQGQVLPAHDALLRMVQRAKELRDDQPG